MVHQLIGDIALVASNELFESVMGIHGGWVDHSGFFVASLSPCLLVNRVLANTLCPILFESNTVRAIANLVGKQRPVAR